MEAERGRQANFDQQAAVVNAQSLNRYEGFEGKQQERASTLSDMFTEPAIAAPAPEAALPASSSNVVVQAENDARAGARRETNERGQQLAQLRSFGDLFGSTSLAQARDSGQIGQIAGFKQGSQAVLPYELEAAAQSQQGLKMFGDVLGGIGTVATGAGLSGKSLGSLFGGTGPTVLGKTAVAPLAKGARTTATGLGTGILRGLY